MSSIVTTPDPRLRATSAKVRAITDATRDIVADMVATSLAWENAHPFELSAAMAAPQLGINQRIIIVRDDLDDKSNQSFTALINPEILRTEGKMVTDQEGCLSVPELYGLVTRPNKVKIKALLIDGREVRLRAAGYLARTLQHEIDHLDGILFIDRVKPRPGAFSRLDAQGNLQPIPDYQHSVLENPLYWGDQLPSAGKSAKSPSVAKSADSATAPDAPSDTKPTDSTAANSSQS